MSHEDDHSGLQPPLPSAYRLPPVVQPNWRPRDLWQGRTAGLREDLAQRLCEQYGVRHCLLLDRARSGLYLLCRAFGLEGEWITSSMMHRPSCVVLKQHCAGLALADVDADLTLDPGSAAGLIGADSCALLATHLYGKCADLAALRTLADRHGIVLIENAVHMAGHIDARGPGGAWRIGSVGDATLLSFNVDKPLGAMLGGALLTSRDDIWEAVSRWPLGPANTREAWERIARTYAAYRLKPLLLRLPGLARHRRAADGIAEIASFSDQQYRHYSARDIHPLQAAAALCCSRRESRIVAARRRNARQLSQALDGCPGLGLPSDTPERPHAYTYFPLILRQGPRFGLGRHLATAGIESKWRYYPLHLQPGFDTCRRADLTRTERLWRQHLLVPTGAATDSQQIDYLGECLRAALA